MKKWIAILMALAMILSLAACGGNDKEQDPEGEPQESIVSENTPELPSDEEINQLIASYIDFEYLVCHAQLWVDYNDEADPNGYGYGAHRVTDDLFPDWQAFLDYLGTVFTGEGLDAALEFASVKYAEHNGYLYAYSNAMAWDWSESFSIARLEATGEGTCQVEFWREVRPAVRHDQNVREFLITVLDCVYTEDGWRIFREEHRDSTSSDVNPNLEGYNPYG